MKKFTRFNIMSEVPADKIDGGISFVFSRSEFTKTNMFENPFTIIRSTKCFTRIVNCVERTEMSLI